MSAVQHRQVMRNESRRAAYRRRHEIQWALRQTTTPAALRERYRAELQRIEIELGTEAETPTADKPA